MQGNEIRGLAAAVAAVPTLEQPGVAWQLGHLQGTVVKLLNAAAGALDEGQGCVPVEVVVTGMREYVDLVAGTPPPRG